MNKLESSQSQNNENLDEGTNHKEVDYSRFRISEDSSPELGVVKQLVVKVRKPRAQEFVRVHSSEEYQIVIYILELEEDGNTYLIESDMKDYLAGEIGLRKLVTAISRDNEIFLWPLKLGQNGKYNSWNTSALEAAERAKEKWTRLSSNQQEGLYDTHTAIGSLPEPRWPNMQFNEILDIAFRNKIINTLDHPVIKKLKGAL